MTANPLTGELFTDPVEPYSAPQAIASGAAILRGFALPAADALMQGVDAVIAAAPLRHLVTPGGQTMSVAMSNCGPLGWVSDRRGYRYSAIDPLSNQPWPVMPDGFLALAASARPRPGLKASRPTPA